MVLVLGLLYGDVHWQFCGRVGVGVSDGWGDVFCDEVCGAGGEGACFLVGAGVV